MLEEQHQRWITIRKPVDVSFFLIRCKFIRLKIKYLRATKALNVHGAVEYFEKTYYVPFQKARFSGDLKKFNSRLEAWNLLIEQNDPIIDKIIRNCPNLDRASVSSVIKSLYNDMSKEIHQYIHNNEDVIKIYDFYLSQHGARLVQALLEECKLPCKIVYGKQVFYEDFLDEIKRVLTELQQTAWRIVF